MGLQGCIQRLLESRGASRGCVQRLLESIYTHFVTFFASLGCPGGPKGSPRDPKDAQIVFKLEAPWQSFWAPWVPLGVPRESNTTLDLKP